jgi:serine/threonine-protein kinase
VVDGRYVLIDPLGKGGMGVVWKARSTALDVEVAVKLVRGSTASAEAFKRMAREAHAAARLGHPAMATVLDFGATAEGDPYVVMELLRGESLGEVLGRERRIDVLRAVGTLLPIIDGLREAHDKGIVHRDIKPENLFVSKTERGRLQPKVLDFGIAKLEQQTDSNTKLTQDGAVLGSPGYFSPEQARGQTDIDFRTDIWSISVVLYELITGELPFAGPNYNALLMSILKDTPASIMSHGFGDEELWRIIARGLHRDRDRRWGSMWELGRALAGWLYDQGVRADVASRSLKEVWLDPHTSSMPAAHLEGFSNEPGRRRVLSTLVKRRATDTLAGETMSTLNGQRRLSARALGWGAAAFGVGVILLSVMARGGATPTVTHAATAPTATTPLSAVTPPTPIELEAASASKTTEPEAPQGTQPSSAPAAAKATASKTPPAPRVKAGLRSSTTTPKARRGKAAPKRVRKAPRPAAQAPKTAPTRKKGIDQEFGF